jgi:phytoene synthase
LTVARYASFADLYHYCYQVASAVGLACLKVWGVGDPRAELPAEWCGIAFQLTNILRDVREDFARGRVYLPQDELARFGVHEAEFAGTSASGALLDLLRFQVCRAQSYYDRAAALVAFLEPPAHAVYSAMVRIYRGLLYQIERDPEVILRRRVRLSTPRKLAILLSSLKLRYLSSARPTH